MDSKERPLLYEFADRVPPSPKRIRGRELEAEMISVPPPPDHHDPALVKQNSIGARSPCRQGLGGGAELPAGLRLLDKHFLTLPNGVLR